MNKIKIGILIASKENKVIGYSFEKGFFVCKELFFDESFFEKNIDNETVWFSNIKKEDIKYKNIKDNNYLGISTTDIISYYGLNNVKINGKQNFKIVLKKIYDFILILINNHINAFKIDNLESVNQKSLKLREHKRYKSLIESSDYKELLLLLSLEYNEKTITKKLLRDNKNFNITPYHLYNLKNYKDKYNNPSLYNIIESKSLKNKDLSVVNKKKYNITIDLLNAESLSNIEEKDFFSIKDYQISNLGKLYDVNIKNYKDVLNFDEILFYLITITKTPEIRIFKNLTNTKQWVSKNELEFYVKNGFLVSVDYICENKKESNYENILFNFNTRILLDTINDNILKSKFHQNIHFFNYLQIIKLNGNYILNKFIDSNLKTNCLNLVIDIEKFGFEVVEYNNTQIKISYNESEKVKLNTLLKELSISHSSEIL